MLTQDLGSTGGEASVNVILSSLRTADNLEHSRANALTRDVVDSYFDCLKVTLEQYNLVNAPRQLFNCDETFLPLNISCEKVVAGRNAKHVYAQSRGTSEYITLLCGASAAGVALPPMIIFSKAFPGGVYKFDGRTMQFTPKVSPVGLTRSYSWCG